MISIGQQFDVVVEDIGVKTGVYIFFLSRGDVGMMPIIRGLVLGFGLLFFLNIWNPYYCIDNNCFHSVSL